MDIKTVPLLYSSSSNFERAGGKMKIRIAVGATGSVSEGSAGERESGALPSAPAGRRDASAPQS